MTATKLQWFYADSSTNYQRYLYDNENKEHLTTVWRMSTYNWQKITLDNFIINQYIWWNIYVVYVSRGFSVKYKMEVVAKAECGKKHNCMCTH